MNAKLTISVALLMLISMSGVAQPGSLKADSSKIFVDLFNPEDTLGETIFNALDEFEKFGHFGSVEDGFKSKKYVKGFFNLFELDAKLVDDLTDTILGSQVTLSEYRDLVNKKNYNHYALFLERDSAIATKIVGSNYYELSLRMFKLFSDKAIIGDKYKHGAIYKVSLKFRLDTSVVKFTDVTLEEGKEYQDFILGNYGRHIYSTLLMSNNVESLAKPVPPPYVPTSQPTRSNFFIRAAMQYTDIFSPEAFAGNLDPAYSYSGTEDGRSFGFFYQKAFAKKDIFGLTLGVEYEQNSYQFRHDNAYFVYDSDENGDPLMDLEGTPYNYKHVFLQSHLEDGTLNFVKPEIGLFFNLGQGWFNVQLLGSVGNAFLLESRYDARTTVSYEGEMDGVGTIQEPALGFYNNLEVTSSGTHNEVQSFMFYKGGLGLDFIIEERIGISLLAEYKSSFTYMIRKNSAGKPFLDPDTGAGFGSQFDYLNESRNYQGFSVQAGIKIYLNEKR